RCLRRAALSRDPRAPDLRGHQRDPEAGDRGPGAGPRSGHMRLLEPLTINGLTLPNRVVVPAMVTRLSGEDGFVNEAVRDRYLRYAQGHVGLIVVEATAIHDSKSGPLLRLSRDDYIAGHRDLVRRVHDTSDSKILPQIIHFMKV